MVVRGRSSAAVAVGQGVIGFGLVTIGVVATLATILGFFGSTWWLFDFAASFRPHLAVILMIVALAYALLFSKAMGLLFIAVAVLNGLLVLPLYSGSPAQAAAGETLTVASFNVGQRASIRDATFRWIDIVDPDIVVLLDVTEEWVSAEELAEPYVVRTDLPADRTYGISILTKEPVETEVTQVGRIRDSVVRVEAAVGGQPIAIYAVQTRSGRNQTDSDYRDEYLADVGRMVEEESLPAVVVGDFQASPWSHAFRKLATDADLANSQTGFGLQPTWPANSWSILQVPFDHLLHSKELTTVDRYLGPTFGVDHRPLVVELARAA